MDDARITAIVRLLLRERYFVDEVLARQTVTRVLREIDQTPATDNHPPSAGRAG